MIGEYGPGGHRFGHELIRRAGLRRPRRHATGARCTSPWRGALAAAPTGGPPGEIASHLRAAMPLVEPAEVARGRARRPPTRRWRRWPTTTPSTSSTPCSSWCPTSGTEVLLRSGRRHDAGRRRRRAPSSAAWRRSAWPSARRRRPGRRRRPRVRARRAGATPATRRPPWTCCARVQPLAADEAERIKLQASLTRALALSGDGEAARVLGDDVLVSARCLDDAGVRRLAFDAVSYVPWRPQSLDGQLATMRDAATIARAAGDLEWENHATSKTLYGEILAGDLDVGAAHRRPSPRPGGVRRATDLPGARRPGPRHARHRRGSLRRCRAPRR